MVEVATWATICLKIRASREVKIPADRRVIHVRVGRGHGPVSMLTPVPPRNTHLGAKFHHNSTDGVM